MKNDNKVFYITLIVCVLLMATGCFLLINGSKNDNQKSLDSESKKMIEARNIMNVNEYDGDIPNFAFEINGLYSAKITNEFLENNSIPKYEFDAGISDSFGAHTNKYVGVKLSDFIQALNLKEYYGIEIYNNRKKVIYLNFEVDNGMYYLIFLKDGKPIKDNFVSFLAVNHDYAYSLDNVLYVRVK